MPRPHTGESEKDFVKRCVPVVIDEGTTKDGAQAAAICHSMYRRHKEGAHMARLTGVEIFKAGSWKGLSFTEDDLDDIVANYEELRDVHKIPLKLGHTGELKKGQPAFGWAENVRRAGKLLLADFHDVPDKLAQAIQHKMYRTVSIELLMGVKMGKKIFRHLLDAVALLGADQPAVLGLGDLDKYLAERGVAFDDAGHCLTFETLAGERKSTTGGLTMDKDVEERFARLESLITKSRGDDEDEAARKRRREEADRVEKLERDNKRLLAEREEAATKSKKDKIEVQRKAAKDVIEEAIKAKKIQPAQRDYFTRLHKLDDDAAVEALNVEEFRKMFDLKAPRQGSEGLDRHTTGDVVDDEEVDSGAQMLALTREHMLKHGLKPEQFADALDAVSLANPKLHRAYLLSNGEAVQ